MSRNVFAAIDIGTSKILTIIAKYSKEAPGFEILGHGTAKSNGISRGIIEDIEEASFSIEQSLKEAEKSAGYKVSSALITLAGEYVESITAKSSVSIAKYPREIGLEDKLRLEEVMETRFLRLDKSVIHKIAYNYRIDDGNYVKNPVGMIGSKIDAEIHIVTSITNTLNSLVRCVKNLGINNVETVFSGYASSLSVLTDTEKRIGAILIDMGAGTTDIAFIKNNKLINSAVIPIGGDHFTNDIASVLNIDLKSAEDLKRSLPESVKKQEEDVDFKSDKRVNLNYLKTIVNSRSEELLEYVKDIIRNANCFTLMSAGIVLTGGGANTFSFKELAEDFFRVSVRVGFPNEKVEALKSLESSAAIGLLHYQILEVAKNNAKRDDRVFGIIKSKLKELFSSFVE